MEEEKNGNWEVEMGLKIFSKKLDFLDIFLLFLFLFLNWKKKEGRDGRKDDGNMELLLGKIVLRKLGNQRDERRI